MFARGILKGQGSAGRGRCAGSTLRAVIRVSAALMAPLAGCGGPALENPRPGGSVKERGVLVMHQHACNACHVIPGVTGGDVHIGPPLAGMARRSQIAGALPNTIENMVRWLRDPQAVDPRTAMPAMGLTERDARDIAAYLALLH